MMTINQEVERKTDIGYPEFKLIIWCFLGTVFEIPKSICLNIEFGKS